MIIQKMNKILVVLCAVLVGACGGGGGGANEQPASKPQVVAKPVFIDAQGDSTMYGLTNTSTTGTQWQSVNNTPALLQPALATATGLQITVTNDGVPGASIRDRLQGVCPHYCNETLPVYLSKTNAQIVVENFGLNDVGEYDAAAYTDMLNQFVTDVQQAGKVPVLEEPNPTCSDDWNAGFPPYLNAVRDVAAKRGVLLITQYDAIRARPNWQAELPDCWHPNDALYSFKAQREATALAPLVASLQ